MLCAVDDDDDNVWWLWIQSLLGIVTVLLNERTSVCVLHRFTLFHIVTNTNCTLIIGMTEMADNEKYKWWYVRASNTSVSRQRKLTVYFNVK